MAGTEGLTRAYKDYFADDVRILRKGKMPIIGRQNALNEVKGDKSFFYFANRSVFFGAADMAFITNSYIKVDKNGKAIEQGNFLQVWKPRGNKWQTVLDVFLPAMPEQK